MSAPTPYKVTVRRDCTGCGGRGIERYDAGLGERCCVCKGRCVSRRVVGSLGELRATVKLGLLRGVTNPRLRLALTDELRALPESGGTIELPDGSTITVELTTYDALYESIGKPAISYPHPDHRGLAILAAVNAYYEEQERGRGSIGCIKCGEPIEPENTCVEDGEDAVCFKCNGGAI